MNKAKNITVIPATLNLHTKTPKDRNIKRKVAGYARVSTDSEEQYSSYEAQVDYYSKYIKNNPAWEYVGIYTDEGISGTNMKNREGFNQMVDDALDGKIDLIVTKSVSRFARNTVDSLSTIRKLKDAGVECYFEKENIHTFDSKGELLLTIMSSLAQEESRSLSENVTWGIRKRFADGKILLPYGNFLGYRKGEDGLPEIIPEEAELVRRIYRMFMDGESTNAIAEKFTKEKIPTPLGKKRWSIKTIESMLTNEKYKGCALLQKKFTVDFLSKKTKENEGEVPQYYVENSHPAIIEPEEWELVQIELKRRKTSKHIRRNTTVLSGKIICGDCGAIYGSKLWHSNSKYRRTVWQCNAKFKNEVKCTTPHLYEKDIKTAFVTAMNEYIGDRAELLTDLRDIQNTLTTNDFLDHDIEELEHDLSLTTELIRACINANAGNNISEEQFHERYNELCTRFEETESKLNTLKAERQSRQEQALAIGSMMFEIQELDALPLEFNERLWQKAIEKVVVQADGTLTFYFADKRAISVRV